jgi:mannose-6-phosphate isomerase-like protein (cupin superfamily)
MIMKKKDRIRHKNSETCIAYEYPLGDEDINIAYIEIGGRYPESGCAVNEKVKEMVFVVNGNGSITIEKEKHAMEEGGVVLIHPKQKYFFNGKLKLVMPCTPAWFPEQHKMVDKT